MHGHLNHVTTLSNINYTAISVVQFVTSVVYAHLVKYSIAVIMYLSRDPLVDGLIGFTRSIAHLSNDFNVTYE